MTITICEDWIVTLLYEKVMNLYLYISTHSNNPLGVITGLVSGNILRIHLLCSEQDDIKRRMKEFYVRLLFHEYQRDFLIPVFTKGFTGARVFIKRMRLRLG